MAVDVGLIRYPGSKAKLWRPIFESMPDEISLEMWSFTDPWEYREPFFGAGAIGFRVLRSIDERSSVWLNDKDYGIACLWQTVKESPEELCKRIEGFTPSPKAFEKFKSEDGKKSIDPIRLGFQKLAMHQMSVSGFGAKSGTCLGGRSQQSSKYTVDCRWNPIRLIAKVRQRSRDLSRFGRRLKITSGDFEKVISGAPSKCFCYLDPPYVEKGSMLYVHSMSMEDHTRLAAKLESLSCRWLLSYDDNDLVRRLYKSMNIREVEVRYSNAVTKEAFRPKNREVLISPHRT